MDQDGNISMEGKPDQPGLKEGEANVQHVTSEKRPGPIQQPTQPTKKQKTPQPGSGDGSMSKPAIKARR